MSDKKHIDRIFQEKLKDFEATPNEAVWDNINNQLKKDKDDRKVIPIWWKLAGVAAGLILLLTVGNLIFNDSNNTTKVVDTENINLKNEQTDSNSNTVVDNDDENLEENLHELSNENLVKDNNETDIPNKIEKVAESDKSNTNINQTKSKSESIKIHVKKGSNSNKYLVNSQTNQAPKTNERSNDQQSLTINKANGNIPSLSQENKIEVLVENKTETSNKIDKNLSKNIVGITKEKELIVNDEQEKTLITDDAILGKKDVDEIQLVVDDEKEKIPLTEDLVVSNENSDKEEKEKINRWQINPNIAPVYFNSLGKGSTIHDQLVDNPKTGEINTSYGINVGYVINDKLTIKTGANSLALSYDTNNVILYQNLGANSSSPVDLFRHIKGNDPQISMISADNINAQEINDVLGSNSKAAISQRMNYVEIPLEAEYKLIDKNIGIKVIGGFSTFFLNENEIYSEFDGYKTYVGEATNINDISYSVNLGFGLGYSFSKSISFNLEPKFKYQINTFNDTSGNFRPYIIGLYTGLKYEF